MTSKNEHQEAPEDAPNPFAIMVGLVIDALISLEVAGSVRQANEFGMFDHYSEAQYEFVMNIIPVSLGGDGEGPEREEIWHEMLSKQRTKADFVDQVGRLRKRIAMLETYESVVDVASIARAYEPGPSRLRAMLNEMHNSMRHQDDD